MITLLAAAALALPPVDTPVRADRHASSDAAVVIGIEDYAFLPDVPYAERDAFAVADTLKLSVGIDRNHVTVLTQNPSREQMVRALREASEQAGSDGTVWVYFAGHGAADPASGDRVLLGVDAQADQDTLAARGLTIPQLEAEATASGSEAFVILDACFTGTSREGTDLVPGARMVIPTSWSEPAGVTVWSATEPSQWASPLEAAEHGAFTYAMLGAMRGWADGYIDGTPDGTVTAQEADAYIERTLRDLGVRNQRPSLVGTDRVLVRGDGLEPAPDFNPRPARQPVAVTPPPSSGGWNTGPAPVRERPKRTRESSGPNIPVLATGGALATVGLITVVGSYAAGAGNPDIAPGTLSTLKTVNAIGWGATAVGAGVAATSFVIPTKNGAMVGVRGRF